MGGGKRSEVTHTGIYILYIHGGGESYVTAGLLGFLLDLPGSKDRQAGFQGCPYVSLM